MHDQVIIHQHDMPCLAAGAMKSNFQQKKKRQEETLIMFLFKTFPHHHHTHQCKNCSKQKQKQGKKIQMFLFCLTNRACNVNKLANEETCSLVNVWHQSGVSKIINQNVRAFSDSVKSNQFVCIIKAPRPPQFYSASLMMTFIVFIKFIEKFPV